MTRIDLLSVALFVCVRASREMPCFIICTGVVVYSNMSINNLKNINIISIKVLVVVIVLLLLIKLIVLMVTCNNIYCINSCIYY